MRSSTEVYLRNRASAAGSRDRSSKRKYSDTNRSSPVKPAALAELGAPACNDSAARYRPAGQPSVRAVSSDSSLASSSTPAASSSNRPPARPAGGPPRRSRAPIPCARQRPSGSAGSSRLAIAICEPAGTYSNSAASTSRHDGFATACRSSSTSTSGRSSAGQRAPDARDALRPGRSPRARQCVEHRGRERFDAGESRPRCSEGTPRRRRRGRRARPTRTDADQPPPTRQAASSCRTRPARPRPRTARATRTAARSRPPSPPCRAGSTAQRA